MSNVHHTVITFGSVLLFFAIQDALPWVGLGTGIFTVIWLSYQLFRGIEKRKEEKEKHKKDMEKCDLEMQLLRKQLKNKKDNTID